MIEEKRSWKHKRIACNQQRYHFCSDIHMYEFHFEKFQLPESEDSEVLITQSGWTQAWVSLRGHFSGSEMLPGPGTTDVEGLSNINLT